MTRKSHATSRPQESLDIKYEQIFRLFFFLKDKVRILLDPRKIH